ncbi:MAG: hypothetical protein JOY69_10015 [Candidatus Eremiobacteraeota bacterium]|nr:hypothetical protein [Candidatus Eremiobacteraeota bacterium]
MVDQLLRHNHSEPARQLAAGYSFGFLVRDGLRDAIEHATWKTRRGYTIPKAL